MSFIQSLLQGFRKSAKAEVEAHTDADDAEYDNYCAEMFADAVAERNAIQAEWSSLSAEEQSEVLATIDEMAEAGIADEHRFFLQWRDRLRRQ